MTQSPEEWAAKKGTPPHVLAGARHHHRWIVGEQLTEEQFDAAIRSFLEEPIR